MIQTCKQCGAVNLDEAQKCYFCDALLGSAGESDTPPASRPAQTEGNLAVEPDWRREVSHRLEAFRARRRRLLPRDSQTELPFSPEPPVPDDADEQAALATSSAGPVEQSKGPARSQPPAAEHVEIAIVQPDLDFLGAQYHPSGAWPAGRTSLAPFPIAKLAERRLAGLFDGVFLALAYGGFLALFIALGGHFTFRKVDAAVYGATLALLYALYFGLFTFFGGATPGMQLRRLRVVGFDGNEPTPRQMLWRSFGYLVSGGTILLGFLWALWDEDHLCWQDRISQTYLTAAAAGDRTAHDLDAARAPDQGRP